METQGTDSEASVIWFRPGNHLVPRNLGVSRTDGISGPVEGPDVIWAGFDGWDPFEVADMATSIEVSGLSYTEETPALPDAAQTVMEFYKDNESPANPVVSVVTEAVAAVGDPFASVVAPLPPPISPVELQTEKLEEVETAETAETEKTEEKETQEKAEAEIKSESANNEEEKEDITLDESSEVRAEEVQEELEIGDIQAMAEEALAERAAGETTPLEDFLVEVETESGAGSEVEAKAEQKSSDPGAEDQDAQPKGAEVEAIAAQILENYSREKGRKAPETVAESAPTKEPEPLEASDPGESSQDKTPKGEYKKYKARGGGSTYEAYELIKEARSINATNVNAFLDKVDTRMAQVFQQLNHSNRTRSALTLAALSGALKSAHARIYWAAFSSEDGPAESKKRAADFAANQVTGRLEAVLKMYEVLVGPGSLGED